MPDFRNRAVAVLREPLVHFLMAGALVFAVLSGRPPDAGERRIVVDETVVAGIVNRHVQAFRRPPSDSELDGLIRDYVREEVYYREALRLGLDQGDEVVKKRMRNKIMAIASAEAEAAEPSDAQLQALLDADPARYAAPPRLTLEQRFMGDDSPTLRAAVAAQAKAQQPDAGQPLPLPARYADTPADELASLFGDAFVAGLVGQPTGQWVGPVASAFGIHLVRIERREPAPPPRLIDLRQRLENDWRSAAIRRAENAQFKSMLAGYDIVIERPQ